jgi:metallo-beta-lactamase family protein
MKILLPDSARLQEEEADYGTVTKITKHLPALPLYTESGRARNPENCFR